MKTYEEMARDVLKRRDEELQKLQNIETTYNNAPPEKVRPASPKKRRLLPRIAIPCAAAVTAAAVGITVWNNIPHRGRFVRELAAEGGSPFEPNAPGNSDEKTEGVADIADIEPDRLINDAVNPIASVYKGGETVININTVDKWNIYNLPALLGEDFISIPDDEINEFYGIEFDRFSTIHKNWKSEHEPFGYYNRDTETDAMVGHSVHGYHSTNTIHYNTADCAELSVSARYQKYPSATVENEKSSIINGFDAMVYVQGDDTTNELTFVADIDMGVNVTIAADFSATNCLVDCVSYMEHCEDLFIKYLKNYTAPDRPDTTTQPVEVFNILDEMPQFLKQNDPFIELSTDDEQKFEAFTAEDVNDYYCIEFDRLGKLHEDWNERGKDKLGFYYREYPSVVTSEGAVAGGREITSKINTLEYDIPNGSDIYVRANICSMPEPQNLEDTYKNSYINGHYAVIYRGGRNGYDAKEYPNNDAKFGAMIEFGGTVVNITSAGLSEEEFKDVLRDFTADLIDRGGFIITDD